MKKFASTATRDHDFVGGASSGAVLGFRFFALEAPVVRGVGGVGTG